MQKHAATLHRLAPRLEHLSHAQLHELVMMQATANEEALRIADDFTARCSAQQSTTMANLPHELLIVIAAALSPLEIVRAASACTALRSAAIPTLVELVRGGDAKGKADAAGRCGGITGSIFSNMLRLATYASLSSPSAGEVSHWISSLMSLSRPLGSSVRTQRWPYIGGSKRLVVSCASIAFEGALNIISSISCRSLSTVYSDPSISQPSWTRFAVNS